MYKMASHDFLVGSCIVVPLATTGGRRCIMKVRPDQREVPGTTPRTPKINDFRPARKPCVKNRSVRRAPIKTRA